MFLIGIVLGFSKVPVVWGLSASVGLLVPGGFLVHDALRRPSFGTVGALHFYVLSALLVAFVCWANTSTPMMFLYA